MKIDILTLFPEMFQGFIETSIVARAIEKKLVTITLHNFREYSTDPHHKVDDTPYGGGAGMVLMCQPILDCLKAVRTDESFVILLTPDGKQFDQQMANQFSSKKHLIFLCGHYEGFDERIRSFVDFELSIGDYVLTGGELPAMVVSDAVVRLLPGAIQEESHRCDSFQNNLLDYPTYTKPQVYEGMAVPEVLLSGDHQKIADYRLEEQIKKTCARRPDLKIK